ncbi:AfsA-related hotdog domain-containing protein [Agromyces allii]
MGAYNRTRGAAVEAEPRPTRRAPLIAASAVGRSSPNDVLLLQTERGLEIDVDRGHPIFFDHLLDHVPGTALIEACKQAVQVATGRPDADLCAFDGDFQRVVEFDEPAQVRVHVEQNLATCTITQDRRVALVASAALNAPQLRAR